LEQFNCSPIPEKNPGKVSLLWIVSRKAKAKMKGKDLFFTGHHSVSFQWLEVIKEHLVFI
jgi:hypothetical protein